MAINQVIELSTTAGSNTDLRGVSIAEGIPPSNVNDALRNLGKMIADAVTRPVTKAAGSYTAQKTDHGQLWRATGAVSLALTAAATLTSGWFLLVKGDGGAITIDPDGAELIDGGATYVIPNGGSAMILCTGSAFYVLFNSTGTYVTGTTTPTVTSGTGSFTTVSCALTYTKVGNRVLWDAVVTITDAGTAAGDLNIPLPYTSAVAVPVYGAETASPKVGLKGAIAASSSSAVVRRYDNTTIITTGNVVAVAGQFSV